MAKWINDEGGIKAGGKAYQIQLVVEDDKSSLDGSTAAANKLILDDKVQLVIGPGRLLQRCHVPHL